MKEKNKNMFIRVILLIIYSTFIFSSQLRVGLLGENLGVVNYIFAIAIMYLLLSYKYIFNHLYLCLLMLISIYFLVISTVAGMGVITLIKSYISFILPLFILGIRVEKLSFKYILKKSLIIINMIVILITIIGIIDYFTDNAIILQLSSLMTSRIKELILNQRNSSTHRMYSFMGHPLFNTQLYLIFYILNMLYKKYFTKIMPDIFIYMIPLIGIALTSSKSGLVLYIASILIINGGKFNIKHYITSLIGLILAFKFGLLNNLIVRFTSGDLTTGRGLKWEAVKSINMYPIKFFYGYGTGFTFKYNSIIEWASAGFEYPFRMFSLEHGVFIMLMIYFCIVVIPLIIFIKRRHFTILLAYLIILIDVNTYNGIALVGDYMLVFCIYVFLLLNLSLYLMKEKIT